MDNEQLIINDSEYILQTKSVQKMNICIYSCITIIIGIAGYGLGIATKLSLENCDSSYSM